ncbi:NADH-quinone oxidoreductase subunit NuoN [Saccharolobus solfataricus]|nr:NADH-quinone oxidoreductase subunit NuoN [Saccharolobus solfataricus]AKA73642.1 NADH-quinone oxidoreductase subunit NuoN [Saccharolobus solfataricus]AKA76339.1 NADH-quinone oxidoreductase subunit NuoN [Saccharolobus solfataricus]AKA79031.1 NADH-quinone oxidoreductase subunit NuoN [Saccharolobus solfataricus]AZF68111.1 NADH-quinone oxidoreductase subunit NuoN [Saccharolobus solfataricus]AZF70731.1 NADH-quinone oxidoreductase subunit NuoN [Saccharolobus solfataricus]
MDPMYYLPILIPSIFILFSSISVLFIDNGLDENRFRLSVILSVVLLGVSLAFLIYSWTASVINYTLFSKSLLIDVPGYFFSITVFSIGILAILLSKDHIISWPTRSSMLSLMLLSLLGLFYMSFANNIIIVLTTWAISSAASYAIAMLRKDYKSVDAGIKYLIMGLLSSSIMIIGFASYLISTGSLLFTTSVIYPNLFFFSISFISIAFLFKIGAFPFQAWLPDVYTDADRISVAFISSVGKLIGIIPLFRVVYLSDPNMVELVIFIVISVASMLVGNITAFSRRDVAAILSFSSITQMGYILIGFAMFTVSPAIAVVGILVQSLAYGIAQVGLFGIVSHVEKVSGTSDISGLRGISSQDKPLAFAIVVLILSLLGIPPIFGFWGKLFLFESSFTYPWLTIIAVLNSAISAGYYVPIVREVFREGEFEVIKSSERNIAVVSAILSIILGIVIPIVFQILVSQID